jgi:hypothetical protein
MPQQAGCRRPADGRSAPARARHCPQHVWTTPEASDSAGTALRSQSRVVARATGPRHRRPRLRHKAHRRGTASAAAIISSRSRCRQGRPVCAAVGGPVRAAALTRTLHGWTAPASRWAARRCSGPHRRGNALEQTLRLAFPIRPRGAPKAGTGVATLCPCRGCLPPRNPLAGALRIADRSWRSAAVPLLPLVLCSLSSLRASVWNVMPQGSCVKA